MIPILIFLLKLSIVSSFGDIIEIRSTNCPNNYKGTYLDGPNIIFDYEYQCESIDTNIFFTSKIPNIANAKTFGTKIISIKESITCDYDLLKNILDCDNQLYYFNMTSITKNNNQIAAIISSDNFCANDSKYVLYFDNRVSDPEKIFLSHVATIIAINRIEKFGQCNNIYTYKLIGIPILNGYNMLLCGIPIIHIIYFCTIARKKFNGASNYNNTKKLRKLQQVNSYSLRLFFYNFIIFILVVVIYNLITDWLLKINSIDILVLFTSLFYLLFTIIQLLIYFSYIVVMRDIIYDEEQKRLVGVLVN